MQKGGGEGRKDSQNFCTRVAGLTSVGAMFNDVIVIVVVRM